MRLRNRNGASISRRGARHRDAQRGFTLLELLISMTLLGLVFVLLFGGLQFGMRAWERGSSTADAVDGVRLVQTLLRQEIERVCPRRGAPAAPQTAPLVAFTGEADRVGFLGPAPTVAGGARCMPMTLSVEPDGKFQRLVLNAEGIGGGSDLLRHVQSVEFAYLADRGIWRSSWRDQPALPAAIRVRVTFAPGDARLWPELFLDPRISAEADCTYDPATKSCRGG